MGVRETDQLLGGPAPAEQLREERDVADGRGGGVGDARAARARPLAHPVQDVGGGGRLVGHGDHAHAAVPAEQVEDLVGQAFRRRPGQQHRGAGDREGAPYGVRVGAGEVHGQADAVHLPYRLTGEAVEAGEVDGPYTQGVVRPQGRGGTAERRPADRAQQGRHPAAVAGVGHLRGRVREAQVLRAGGHQRADGVDAAQGADDTARAFVGFDVQRPELGPGLPRADGREVFRVERRGQFGVALDDGLGGQDGAGAGRLVERRWRWLGWVDLPRGGGRDGGEGLMIF